VFGLSLAMRTLAFTSRPDLNAQLRPPGYQGKPNPGAMLDATVYPLAVGHDRTDIVKNLGVNLMYDRVLLISTKDRQGVPYATASSRFGLGAVFRYPFSHAATSPVVIGSLGYLSQSFTVSAGAGQMVDFPSVKYSIFAPGAGLRLPIGDKLVLATDLKLLAVVGTGPLQDTSQYGAASVLGFEGSAGADYAITDNIFARAAVRFETIGINFKGTGNLSTMRDGDPATIDVTAARDTYLGGLVTVGYLY
jgi:opacity protein-like surface antigen